jgi:hypothetical protein
MPDLYKNNLEMLNIINSEEAELEDNLKPNIENSFKNTFILTANLKGIEQYEKLFDIQPDALNESEEFRKARVLNRLITQIPYTERYLTQKLNEMLGEGTWNYEINYNDYTLVITSIIPGRAWLNELNNFLKRIIPCNISYSVEIYSATWSLIKDNFSTWKAIYDENMTWQELMDAEWL